MDQTLKWLTPTYAVLLMRNTAWIITLNGPVMPLYVRSLGIDIVYWGVLATAISAGLFMEIVWGTVLDRVNRRLLILSALVGTSLLYPLYTIKALLPFFIVLQFVFGAINVMIGLTTRARWAVFGPQSVFVIASGAALTAALLALSLGHCKQ